MGGGRLTVEFILPTGEDLSIHAASCAGLPAPSGAGCDMWGAGVLGHPTAKVGSNVHSAGCTGLPEPATSPPPPRVAMGGV